MEPFLSLTGLTDVTVIQLYLFVTIYIKIQKIKTYLDFWNISSIRDLSDTHNFEFCTCNTAYECDLGYVGQTKRANDPQKEKSGRKRAIWAGVV